MIMTGLAGLLLLLSLAWLIFNTLSRCRMKRARRYAGQAPPTQPMSVNIYECPNCAEGTCTRHRGRKGLRVVPEIPEDATVRSER